MPWERLNSLPCVPNKFIKGEKIVCERDVPLTLPPLHIYPTQGPCFPLLTPLLRSLLAPNTVIIIAYPPNWLFTLFSFLGLVLVILPLPWHLQAWNVGTCAYMIWTAIGCFITFISSIAWNGRYRDMAPVWCDISMFALYFRESCIDEPLLATHIMVGLIVAIPVSMLCISRRLYYIASLDPLKRTIKQRRGELIFDLCLCILVPIAQGVVAYIPQGQRYVIYENIDCHSVVVNTWVALLLVSSWPVVLGFISAVYSVLNLILFRKRQKTFDRMLSAHRGLTAGRYTRLMFIAIADIIFKVPITLYVFCMNAASLVPWISWEETHFAFNVIYVYPAVVWQTRTGFALEVEVERYLFPFSALIFFITIGLTGEARGHYRRALDAVLPSCGRSFRIEFGNPTREDETIRTEIGFMAVEGQ
ncbi:pheromone A receptor-domain-containing protein [Mucidula mucida]|nr:pheromone A receptor-domain-containing protein [Mucidula mucida]